MRNRGTSDGYNESCGNSRIWWTGGSQNRKPSPLPAQPDSIAAQILVLHGDADPVVPLESVIAFREEMRLADANWQINIYGQAKHSFTGEGAMGDRTPEAGLHAQTEARSWQTTVEFLREVLVDW